MQEKKNFLLLHVTCEIIFQWNIRINHFNNNAPREEREREREREKGEKIHYSIPMIQFLHSFILMKM